MTGYYKVWVRSRIKYPGEISPPRLDPVPRADGEDGVCPERRAVWRGTVQTWVWPYHDAASRQSAMAAAWRWAVAVLRPNTDRRCVCEIRSVAADCELL